jgi:hypothetical protein
MKRNQDFLRISKANLVSQLLLTLSRYEGLLWDLEGESHSHQKEEMSERHIQQINGIRLTKDD